MTSILSSVAEVHAATRLPGNHIAFQISKTLGCSLREALFFLREARMKVLHEGYTSDLFRILNEVLNVSQVSKDNKSMNHNVRGEKPQKTGYHPLSTHDSKKPLEAPKDEDVTPNGVPSKVESRISISKRPKLRKLRMDMDNIRRRMEYRVHKPTAADRAHRKLVRKLWMKRNASALHRRRQFLRNYWRQHSGLRRPK